MLFLFTLSVAVTTFSHKLALSSPSHLLPPISSINFLPFLPVHLAGCRVPRQPKAKVCCFSLLALLPPTLLLATNPSSSCSYQCRQPHPVTCVLPIAAPKQALPSSSNRPLSQLQLESHQKHASRTPSMKIKIPPNPTLATTDLNQKRNQRRRPSLNIGRKHEEASEVTEHQPLHLVLAQQLATAFCQVGLPTHWTMQLPFRRRVVW